MKGEHKFVIDPYAIQFVANLINSFLVFNKFFKICILLLSKFSNYFDSIY